MADNESTAMTLVANDGDDTKVNFNSTLVHS